MRTEELLDELIASGSNQTWGLSKFPGRKDTLRVEVVNARNMTAESFRRDCVERNRPCLIEEAAHHWPAFGRWQSRDYLRQKTTETTTVMARCRPIAEMVFGANPSVRTSLITENDAALREISFHQFLEVLESKSIESQITTHGSPLISVGDLLPDVNGFSFLPSPPKTRMYAPYRAFFYRGSYTDWHYHPTDEGLMVQVVGAKEVLLLPPDRTSWNALWPIVQQHGYLYDIDPRRSPEVLNLKPYRVVVRPGDALYIPVFWWHAVESVGKDFGITVAATFPTPIHINADLGFPAARFLLRQLLRSKKGPFVAAAATYAAMHKVARSLYPN
jgi:hypothetical protein